MLPERFQESSCLKCHHQVVELETSPQFGNSAPKLMKGYHTIETFGCFGCHEVNGFAGQQSIGPDLRLEPNWFAAALQIKADAVPLLGGRADKGPTGAAGAAVAEQPGPETEAATGLDEPAAKSLERIVELADHIADSPFESDAERDELRTLLLADESLKESRLSGRTHALADELADVAHPGRFRKVGPSLRYLNNKTDADWIAYWTEQPSRFRPTTRMPQFFHLTNQDDPAAGRYQPAEIQAITAYLLSKSEQQPFDYLAPAADYKPDADRGKKLFSERGCLACHSHSEFPGIAKDFGPKLDTVHAKLKDYDPAAENFTQSDAFGWLYTWLRDPQRYHKRSRMPNLYLETYPSDDGSQTIDPAADIAAWLCGSSSSPAASRSASASKSSSAMRRAAPASTRLAAFARWWPAACGYGTTTIGTPMALASASVDEPARPTTRSALASAASISSRRNGYGR
jgi:cytochrome c2